MKNTSISCPRLIALCVAAALSGSAYAAAPEFRASFPGDSPSTSASAPSVRMRDADVVTRPVMSSGKDSAGEFVPTKDPGDGNFEFRHYGFTLTVNQGYDDNIYTSHFDKQESAFTSASLGFNWHIGTPQTTVILAAHAGGSFYWDREDDYDPDFGVSLSLIHAISRKFTLSITSNLSYQTEPDFSNGFGLNRRSGKYFFGSIGASLSQQWSRRFSTVYSYGVNGIFYDDSVVADTDNRIDQTFGLQLRYLLQPDITLVGEYRFGITTYDTANRDSTSHYVLVGADFTVNRRLTVNIRAGGQFRDSDDAGSDISPYMEGVVSYKLGEYTALDWVNRYGFEESDSLGADTRQTYRTGLAVNHRFSPRIRASLSTYFTNSSYSDGLGFDENTLDINGTLVYAINRVFSLQLGYTYTQIFSDDTFREYERNRVYFGATASF